MYLDAHLLLHSGPEAHRLFESQAAKFEEHLREAEARLAAFAEKEAVSSIPQQKELTLRRMMDVRAKLQDAETSYAESEARLAEIRAQLERVPARITRGRRVLPNQYSVERLQTLLVQLQNQRAELLTRYQPDDRLVVEVEQQIAQTAEALEEAKALTAIEEETDVNPVREALERQLADAQLGSAGLLAKKSRLAAELKETAKRLAYLEDKTGEFNTLERQVEQAEQNLLLYARKQEEARISDTLDRQKIANVAIAEEPLLPVLPSSPNVPVNLAIGFGLAGLCGLGAAAAREAASRRILEPAQIEEAVRLPVLGVIPARRS